MIKIFGLLRDFSSDEIPRFFFHPGFMFENQDRLNNVAVLLVIIMILNKKIT